MGLLSNPQRQRQIKAAFTKYYWHISLFLYILGVLSVFLLPLVAEREHTQDNSLGGAAAATFRAHSAAVHSAIQSFSLNATESEIQAQLLEYVQTALLQRNVTFQAVHVRHEHVNVVVHVKSSYGIGGESLLVHIPVDKDNLVGTVFGVQLVENLDEYSWWEKDVLILFSCCQHYGVESFVQQYMSGDDQTYLGSILAGITILVEDEDVNNVVLELAGTKGNMPNMDLVMVAKYRSALFFPVLFSTEDEIFYLQRHTHGTKNEYTHMLKSLGYAASAMVIDWAAFLQNDIQTLTMRFRRHTQSPTRTNPLSNVGKAIESVLRVLNNLDQRLNLSFMYYMPLGLSRFVSIGKYMGPVLLVVLSVLVFAVKDWTSCEAIPNQLWRNPDLWEIFKGSLWKSLYILTCSTLLINFGVVTLDYYAQRLDCTFLFSIAALSGLAFMLNKLANQQSADLTRAILSLVGCLTLFVLAFTNAPLSFILATCVAPCYLFGTKLLPSFALITFAILVISWFDQLLQITEADHDGRQAVMMYLPLTIIPTILYRN